MKDNTLQRKKTLNEKLKEIEFKIDDLTESDKKFYYQLDIKDQLRYAEKWVKLKRAEVRAKDSEEKIKEIKKKYDNKDRKKDTWRKCKFGGAFAECMGRKINDDDYKMLWRMMSQNREGWRNKFNNSDLVAEAVKEYDKYHNITKNPQTQ